MPSLRPGAPLLRKSMTCIHLTNIITPVASPLGAPSGLQFVARAQHLNAPIQRLRNSSARFAYNRL